MSRLIVAGLWAPPLVTMATIFALSSVPGDSLGPVRSDKAIHFAVFGLLAVLLLRALNGGLRSEPSAGTFALAVGLTVVYGALDELHQSFVPGRSPSLADLGADAAGALLCALLLWGWLRSRSPP